MAATTKLNLPRPYCWLPPATWRTRLMAVEADLDSNGPLARDLARVQKGKKDLDSVLERHADLLPGEAGRRVAQAIIDGERINRFRRVGLRDSPKLGLRAWENVFDDPVSQYVPLEAVRVARA